MRRISRVFIAGLLVTQGLVVGAVPTVLARSGPTVGTEVTYTDDQGVTHGTIQVKELNDPFTGFDPARPADSGTRYVGLTVVFTAADDQQFDANPYYVVIRDTNGFLYTTTYIPRPQDAPIPDLQSQTLAPGNRISGFVGYILPTDAKVDDVFYTWTSQAALPLVEVDTSAGPAPDQPVTFAAADGSQAQFTLTLTDPFTTTSSTPADGERFVGLKVVVENNGNLPFDSNPSELYLRDSAGNLYYPQGVSRDDTTLPDLQSQTLSPGDRVSGFVGYSIPAGAAVVAVDYWVDGGRRATLADLVGGGPAPSAGPAVTPAAQPSAAPVASPAPGESAGVSQ